MTSSRIPSAPVGVFERVNPRTGKVEQRAAYTAVDVVKFRFDGWREVPAPTRAPAATVAPAKAAPKPQGKEGGGA